MLIFMNCLLWLQIAFRVILLLVVPSIVELFSANLGTFQNFDRMLVYPNQHSINSSNTAADVFLRLGPTTLSYHQLFGMVWWKLHPQSFQLRHADCIANTPDTFHIFILMNSMMWTNVKLVLTGKPSDRYAQSGRRENILIWASSFLSYCFLSDLVPKSDGASRMIARAFCKPSEQRKFPSPTRWVWRRNLF